MLMGNPEPHKIPGNIEKTLPDCFDPGDPLITFIRIVTISQHWLNFRRPRIDVC